MDRKEPTLENGENSPVEGVNGATDTGSSATAAPQPVEALTAERDRLLEENHELLDRLLRRQAEFDNFRRRAEREKSDVLEFAHSDSVRAIVPILDDFERALKTPTADKVYARGMEMIYQRLGDALKKLGLE